MNFYVFLSLTLIQPFWAIIAYFATLSKRIPQIKDFVIISLIISIMGIYWIPWGDNQTHFVIYNTDVVAKYYKFSLISSNFLYDYVISIIAKCTGQYVWGYFFWIFVSVLIYLTSVWNSNKTSKYYTLAFIFLILSIGIRELLDLNRNFASCMFLISGIFRFKKSKLVSILFLFISTLLHSTSIIIIICALISKIVLKKCSKRIFIFCLFISFIFMFSANLILHRYASPELVDAYVDGVWGSGTGVNSGFAYLINFVNLTIFIYIGYIFYKNFHLFKSSPLFYLYFATLILSITFWMLWTMRERFAMINIFTGTALIVSSWDNLISLSNNKRKIIYSVKMIILLFCFRFALIIGQTYSSQFINHTGAKNPSLVVSITAREFYMPTILLLDIKEFGFSNNIYLKQFPRVQNGIMLE